MTKYKFPEITDNHVCMIWWNSLTIDEKVAHRAKYEKNSAINDSKKKNKFSMESTIRFRIGQIPNRLIDRIFVFKDYQF